MKHGHELTEYLKKCQYIEGLIQLLSTGLKQLNFRNLNSEQKLSLLHFPNN